MIGIEALSSLLSSLNPDSAAISGLFGNLSKIDPKILDVLLQSMNEQMLQKLALWSQAFTQTMNAIPTPNQGAAGSPTDSTDFDSTMNGTVWKGELLTPQMIDDVSNSMTKALKAENWMEAINVTLTLFKSAAVL